MARIAFRMLATSPISPSSSDRKLSRRCCSGQLPSASLQPRSSGLALTRTCTARGASPDISSRAAIIAQDFARARVLGAFSRGARGGTPRMKTASARGHPSQEKSGSIAMPYGVASTGAHAGKSAPRAAPSAPPVARPHRARARPAHFVSGRISEKNDICLFDKRLGEISGLGRTPPFVDGQIAAIAHINDLVLITSNTGDFEHFRGLRVQSWA